MSALRRELLGLLLALAGLAAVVSLALDAENERRVTAVAVEADDAVAVCRRSGCALGDFWDRAKAMGVSAVVMREKPLSYLAERGEVLAFSRQELEKWRATGLLAPGAALRPNTVWTKDDALLEQLASSARRRGLAVSTSAAAGYAIAEFPEGIDPSLPAGLDPQMLGSLGGRSLAVIRAAADKPATVGFSWETDGRPDGEWPASPGEALVLEPSVLPVDAHAARWLRAAFSHPRRLLLARLKTDEGVEENFDALRAALRRLQSAGVSLGLPSRAPQPAASSAARRALKRVAGWLLGVIGPLFAARAGLLALKRARSAVLIHSPVLAPVAQLAAGLLATAAAAIGIGLTARLAFDGGAALPPPSWGFWCLAGPLAIGALTLYAIDPDEWMASLKKPLTGAGVLKAAAVVAAAAALLAPRAAARLVGAALPASLSGAAWWVSWRWREVFVGVPCLLQSMGLIDSRSDCPECESGRGHLSDPRGWFVLGMLWPIGIVMALCRGGAPVELTLAQTGQALAAGAGLGAAGLVWRFHGSSGPKGPSHHRTIVPDAKV